MILTSESKLCVTLVLILALLAVMNMDTKSKPVANIGAVQNSSSSSIDNTVNSSKSSNSSTVEKMEQKGKSSKTPSFKTNTSSKTVTSKTVISKKPTKSPAAKTVTVAKKAAKVSKPTKKAKGGKKFKASDYLPKQVNKKWWNTDFSVAKNKVNNKNLIPTQNYITGINTVASSLRLANHDLRARPANPQIVVSPWLNTTVAPDHNTKPLGI
jgi:hypothetical protein